MEAGALNIQAQEWSGSYFLSPRLGKFPTDSMEDGASGNLPLYRAPANAMKISLD